MIIIRLKYRYLPYTNIYHIQIIIIYRLKSCTGNCPVSRLRYLLDSNNCPILKYKYLLDSNNYPVLRHRCKSDAH